MEIRQLRQLVVLAEELHFGRAAERLHIEQPPLSRSIKALEEELGVVLFTRAPRGTQLTAAGVAAVAHARHILGAVDELRSSARAAHEAAGTTIRIGLLESLGQPRLPEVLALLRDEEPGIDAALSELSFPQQVKALRDGQVDLCLRWAAEAGDGLASEALWTDELVAVLPARHALADRASVPLASLARETLVVGKPDFACGTSEQFIRLLAPHTDQPIRTTELLSSLGMMAPMVAMGHGVGLSLGQSGSGLQQHGVVVRPLQERAVLTTYLLRRDEAATPAIERFIRCAHRVAAQSQAVPAGPGQPPPRG